MRLSYLDFPELHLSKLHSRNLLERLNKMGYPAGKMPIDDAPSRRNPECR